MEKLPKDMLGRLDYGVVGGPFVYIAVNRIFSGWKINVFDPANSVCEAWTNAIVKLYISFNYNHILRIAFSEIGFSGLFQPNIIQ